MHTLIWIGLGGSLGSIARALCTSLSPAPSPGSFPIATLVVNVVGCLIIGSVYGSLAQTKLSSSAVAFLTTGFCGGFTTFSAFSMETVTLLRDGHTTMAMLYGVLSVALGIVATGIGIWAARLWQ
ncbi:MAG: fluoride efflux transporter CrcB [Candidatus Kapaibacterium sp.]